MHMHHCTTTLDYQTTILDYYSRLHWRNRFIFLGQLNI
jgi:hypothetical protein